MTTCIVGLGNPGRRYAATRHNVGFDVLAILSQRLHCRLEEGTGDFLIGEHQDGDNITLLLAPTTFMNDSGIAVREVSDALQIAPSNILVVLDDFQLPLGTLRLRARGSDGGHNGLSSVIYHLMTDDVPRLRIGIGGDTLPLEQRNLLMADYVLSAFTESEREILPTILNRAADACLAWRSEGIDRAMSSYNKPLNPAPPSPPTPGDSGGAKDTSTSKGE
jgi:peptidyl-tRNA hydrolase, PTH1 family